VPFSPIGAYETPFAALPAPSQAPAAGGVCGACAGVFGAQDEQPLSMELKLQAGSELARYPLNGPDAGYDMNVVFFVINATFSRPPASFGAADVSIVNGAHTAPQASLCLQVYA
jgi:hypothetical protein